MKRLMKITTILGILLLFSFASFAQKNNKQCGQYALTLPKQDLSQTEKQVLSNARQVEKLVHDVHFTLYSKWNIPALLRKSSAAEIKTQCVKQLINKYDLQDPVNDNEIGKFADNNLTKQYNLFVEQGSKSLNDAFTISAQVLEFSLYNLNQDLTKVDNDDIKLVLNNLKNSTEKEFAMTVKRLEKFGITYTPKYISQQEFTRIISQFPKHKQRKQLQRPMKRKQQNN